MPKRNDAAVQAIIREHKDLATSEIQYRATSAQADLIAIEVALEGLQDKIRETRKLQSETKYRVAAFEALLESRR